MLVEDDNNLREIYEARLLAEGYEIVSAKDGEEALAIAVKEKPDLIISDVMMPKISGFDMLDILRSTAETKDTKVIMMTALSQAEDKERADKLGADRYLVKSQVTLEDVAKVAKEVLDGTPAGGAASPQPAVSIDPSQPTTPIPAPPPADDTSSAQQTPVPVPEPTAAPAPGTQPVAATPEPPSNPATISIPITQPPAEPATQAAAPTPAPVSANVDDQIANFMSQASVVSPTTAQTAPQETEVKPNMPTVNQESHNVGGNRVLQPLHDISSGPTDLNALLAKEQANEAMASAGAASITPPATPISDITPPTPPAPAA